MFHSSLILASELKIFSTKHIIMRYINYINQILVHLQVFSRAISLFLLCLHALKNSDLRFKVDPVGLKRLKYFS